MIVKKALQLVALLSILFSFACEDELEDCYETVCTGPNMTNCTDIPRVDSGCFPRETGVFEEELN